MHPGQATTTVWDGSSPGIFESYAKCGKHTGSGISTGRASEPEDDALGTGLKGGLQQLTGPTTRRGTPSSPVWLDQLDPRCLSQFNDGFATPTMVPPRPRRGHRFRQGTAYLGLASLKSRCERGVHGAFSPIGDGEASKVNRGEDPPQAGCDGLGNLACGQGPFELIRGDQNAPGTQRCGHAIPSASTRWVHRQR